MIKSLNNVYWILPFLIFNANDGFSQDLTRLQATEQKTTYLDEGSIREGGGYITYETVHIFNKPAEIMNEQNIRVLVGLAIMEVAGDCNYQIRGIKSVLFFPVDKSAAPFRTYFDVPMIKDKPGSNSLFELNRACAFGK